ncbi:hypothetical protein DN745_13380 [Bradymonas sediminis]|uniref:Uncharacterized protein n=1 Tax=Bradymonas sediminis TaxID=1548548 RepID=A0A2Z4FNJ9_9DELT|nr:hypothetical protein DN745_13380 [Bradymonas sediminis]
MVGALREAEPRDKKKTPMRWLSPLHRGLFFVVASGLCSFVGCPDFKWTICVGIYGQKLMRAVRFRVLAGGPEGVRVVSAWSESYELPSMVDYAMSGFFGTHSV